MKYLKTLFCLILFINIVPTESARAANDLFQQIYPSKIPDRIILNLTATPSASMAVTWRTDTTVTKGIAQIAVATPDLSYSKSAKEIVATTNTYLMEVEKHPNIKVNHHSVIFTNLYPDTLYIYRVGNGEIWSEWLHFKTAGEKNDPITFIYFGDAQNNIKAMWSRVVREAFITAPQANFLLYAGDLINHTDNDLEWHEWFGGASFIHRTIPSVMTAGNHEYDDLNIDKHWRAQFTLPENGPRGLEELCYYVDYQDLRLISIDSETIDESPKFRKLQQTWLDSILTYNPQKWTALTLHIPFFSTKPSRNNPELRQAFRPIIEKHKVDIVLQGHDHAYGRGMEKIPSSLNEQESTPTLYVVSVSGPKMYDLSDRSWMTRRAKNNQFFQVITIHNDTLNFKAYTATRELYDEFLLIKQAGKNKLINKIPAVPERVE